MLSILIPTYNYDISPLVHQLHTQALAAKIDFEIIVIEDGSKEYYEKNVGISELFKVTYERNKKNIGRTATRNLLAEKSKFDNLLFLDADVMPSNDKFLKKYLKFISKYDVVFGGVSYSKKEPSLNKVLRWKYGINRESKSVSIRNKNPYLTIISMGFLIKKSLFLKVNSFLKNIYGIDVYFSTKLEESKCSVLHIDNPVIHLGLENSSDFLKKTIEGLKSLILFENEKLIPTNYRPIQKAYLTLNRFYLKSIYIFIIGVFKSYIKTNITSKSPSLFLFDLYKLYYYSKLK